MCCDSGGPYLLTCLLHAVTCLLTLFLLAPLPAAVLAFSQLRNSRQYIGYTASFILPLVTSAVTSCHVVDSSATWLDSVSVVSELGLVVGSSGSILVHLLSTANSSHHRLLHFSRAERERQLTAARAMFQHGFGGYMRHAFPLDELDPVHCRGRGPDWRHPDNLNINDVLGGYSLTLVDVLDTLAVMGETQQFRHAVQLVIDHVHFNVNSTVQVFEANIRVLGALLSAHLLMVDDHQPFGLLRPPGYANQLLLMARDLGRRLMAAFKTGAVSGLPWPRINLLNASPVGTANTCTSGAGSLLLELGVLSRLVDEPAFETAARGAVTALWRRRAPLTGLPGFTVNASSGDWTSRMSGLGAGMDSFYEYLLKAYIMFGDMVDYNRFTTLYRRVKRHMRVGRRHCNAASASSSGHPLYVNVDMTSGEIDNTWVDSLQAAFPAVQLLAGDLEEAVCHHAFFYAVWKRYGALPERFNWHLNKAEVMFYPLRPELAESTYFLYRATRNPFYLHVGREILTSLETHTRARCGYTTLRNVVDKSHEDRMESFFLSETCKYLYLLFDEDNYVNEHEASYVFSTEGHLFPVRFEYGRLSKRTQRRSHQHRPFTPRGSRASCDAIPLARRFSLPIKPKYLHDLMTSVGTSRT